MRLEVDLDMSTEEVEYGTRLILPPNKGDPWRQGDLVGGAGRTLQHGQCPPPPHVWSDTYGRAGTSQVRLLCCVSTGNHHLQACICVSFCR
jgi:hypothetical protein